MESHSRRRRRSRAAMEEEDRLSSLPDDLLHSILRSLPLKHAARTSALSRRWARRWLRALAASPVLDFTDRDSTVGRCLRLHAEHGDAPLDAFRVALVSPPPGLVGDVVVWIAAAVARGAREVEVDLAPPPPQEVEDGDAETAALVELPGDVFRARSSLERLALGGLGLRAVALPAAGLAGLRSLSLTHADVTGEAVRAVLAGCPALESLALIRCPLLTSVTVAGEALRVLEIAGCRAVCKLPVAAPALESLAFDGRLYFSGYGGGPVAFDLGATPALRDAYLSHLGYSFDIAHDAAYPYLYNAVARARTLTICSVGLLLLQQARSVDETVAYVNAPNLEELQLLMGADPLEVELEHLSAFFTIASLGPVPRRLFVRIISPAILYYAGGRGSSAAEMADETVFDQLALIKVVNFSGTKRELRCSGSC